MVRVVKVAVITSGSPVLTVEKVQSMTLVGVRTVFAVDDVSWASLFAASV